MSNVKGFAMQNRKKKMKAFFRLTATATVVIVTILKL